MNSLFWIALFALGTIIGSFLNVATLRYKPEGRLFALRDIRGRSHCPQCGKTLGWHELIPLLSFILQRGRCRSCTGRLSLQYPLVEIAIGFLVSGIPALLIGFWGIAPDAFFSFGAVWWQYALVALWTLLGLLLLVILIIDLRHSIIPNGVNLTIGVLGACITILLVLFSDVLPSFRDSFLTHYSLLLTLYQNVLFNHLIGFAAGGILFGALHFFTRGRAMGMGDVKLAAALGLAFGWPDIMLAIALSFIVGGAWGAFLLLSGRRRFGDRIPFGPFLVVGCLLTLFLGEEVLTGYFRLFGA